MEIIRDILTSALTGKTKTEIVYNAKLNFKLFDRYATLLLEKNFLSIKYRNSCKVYVTTRKGKEILNRINEILDMIFG